eukprot:gene840-865_t
MAKGYIGKGIKVPDSLSVLPMMLALFIQLKGLNDLEWDMKRAWELLLKNPLFGGELPVREELPFWTYMAGHWLTGSIVFPLIIVVVSLPCREWRYTSGPREDLRGFFETYVSLIASAPVIGWCWQQFLEGNVGQFYYDASEYGYAYIAFSALIQLLCLETWFYWLHTVSHMRPVYKLMHETHHSYVPTITACAAAFHPLDLMLLTTGAFIGPLIVPQWQPMTHIVLLIQGVWTVFVHVPNRFDLRPYTLGYGIISDPTLHNIHHDYGMKPTNLGSMLCLWDHVGGTYYPDIPIWADVTPAHSQYEEHKKRRDSYRPDQLQQRDEDRHNHDNRSVRERG